VRPVNFWVGYSSEIGRACSTAVSYGRSVFPICSSLTFIVVCSIAKNGAKPVFILGFFFLSFFGFAHSQSLDSLTEVRFNRDTPIDTLTLDSLRQIRESAKDSLNRMSQKVGDFGGQIIQNRNFKKVSVEKWNVIIPEIPSMKLPEIKMPELARKRLDDQMKAIGEKMTKVSNNVGDDSAEVSVIGSTIDSLRKLNNIDSVVLNAGESLVDRIEQQIYHREELTELSETADIKSAFSGKLAEGGLGEGTSELQKLNPRQIQQEYILDLKKVKEAQTSLGKYKAKYNMLADSRLEGEGVKRHSLKDTPFFQRTEVGLFGQFTSFKPFTFHASAGYRIDRRWTSGAGAMWSIGGKQPAPKWTGIKAFGQYWIKESFFVQTEYQNLSSKGYSTEKRSASKSAFLGGLGTEVQVYRSFRLRSTVLYRFNKWDVLLQGFESPWQASLGIIYKIEL
jgi:hypothetical protein